MWEEVKLKINNNNITTNKNTFIVLFLLGRLLYHKLPTSDTKADLLGSDGRKVSLIDL